jgi:DNA-binding CsgD family transcriptional regulator
VNFDVFLVIAVLLLFLTLALVILYYRRMQRVHEEYEAAKNVVRDIILSFNKQLKVQEDRLHNVAQKTYTLSSKSDEVEKKIELGAERLGEFATKVEAVAERERAVLLRLDVSDKKTEELSVVQKEMLKEMEALRKVEPKVSAAPEAKIRGVIPIKKEQALAPLTETELKVLEMLTAEGEKTAPQINEKLQLSREHMSRLMKKLYVTGYLERKTRKIPYTYLIKEEMLRIMKKKAEGEV